MIEVSNVLVSLGHQVTIYHPEGHQCTWLKCRATCKALDQLPKERLDVLIGIVDWQTELYQDVVKAEAKIKAICLLGFSPQEEMAKALRGEIEPRDKAESIIVDAMRRSYSILTDSSWQIDWMIQNIDYPAGPSFGGINTRMFRPSSVVKKDDALRVVYSGDPRERKGTDTVEKAIAWLKEWYDQEKVVFESYWGKRFNQQQLVEFLQKADIFLDGHRRAGWCNPVIEAMACGAVPICTSIGATRDFAIHNKTALLVEVDDDETMAQMTARLLDDHHFRNQLRTAGIAKAKEFDYEIVGKQLEEYLVEKLGE